MKKALIALALGILSLLPALAAEEMGNKDAKVIVKAFLPTQVDCHRKTINILKDIAQKDPDRVYIRIYELRTDESNREIQKYNLSCASVFVNDKNQFRIDRNGKPVSIEMTHKPNEPDSTYNSEDVQEVIAQAVREAYEGAPAPQTPGGLQSPIRRQPQPQSGIPKTKDEYGPKTAKVKMVVLVPPAPQQENAPRGPMAGMMGDPVEAFRNFIVQTVAPYKGKVHLRFIDIESDQGAALMKRFHFRRGVYILVNNQHKFRVPSDDPDLAYKDVRLIGLPGNAEAPYMRDDLKKVLDIAVKKAYAKK
ncbi:MAG: hypothetical protein IT210_01605 [Armatimonadetes bacterium]|nr:hypothetical protein [Armatimonadota bacterium]